jgi:hypothetical protein
MNFRLEKELDKFYAVSSANWEVVVKAPTRNDACICAIKGMYDKLGGDLLLSPAVACIDVSSTFTEITCSNTYSFVPTKEVLRLAGLTSLAKSIEKTYNHFLRNKDE